LEIFQDWFKYILLSKEKGEKNLIISIEEGRDVTPVSLFVLEKKLSDFDFDSIYVVLGHEINGVDQFIVNKSDFVVTIPMNGKKNSLNVSTCAGIVGYRIKEILASMQ
jgi:tRNA G18 (ribose-2'-O)-methylase SpoU